MEEGYVTSDNKMNILGPDDPDIISNLGIMAAKIAYYNFEWRYMTLVMISTMQSIAFQTFLMNYNQSFILQLSTLTPCQRAPVSQFVIFGHESMEISSILLRIASSKCDCAGKFIVVCHSDDYAKCDEIQVFQALANLFIFNVVFLKASCNDDLKLYSYQVILPNKCFNTKPKEIDLATKWNNNSRLTNIFPEKFKSFHGCTLVISTIEQPPFMFLRNGTKPSGKDGEIITFVASILNATLVMKTPTEPECGHYQKNNWTGSLGDIYYGLAHLSMCSAPLTSNKYENFQTSFPYYYMEMVWAARLPPLRPSWEKLLYPLCTYLRMSLLFIFIGIVSMNIFAKTNIWNKVRRVFKLKPPKRSYLFYSWALFLGMPIQSNPSKLSVRIMIYTWIWFCFIIRCAYQAALINSLKLNVYQDNLETYKDVLKYPYGGTLTLRDYYLDNREIYNNWTFLRASDTYNTLDKILNGSTNFVLALNKETIRHHLKQYNGTKQLQILPEIIVNSPAVLYFKKYSPFTAAFSEVLTTAFEAGLIQYSYRRNMTYETNFLHKSNILDGPHPLAMEHFSGCFVLLIAGWVSAVICFIVEVIRGIAGKKNV